MKHWTTIEEQILREHFPQAGIPACRELLPGRSDGAIQQHAYQMKLKSRTPRDGYQRHKSTPMLDDAIRELYQSRPEKGCIYAFAKKWGYPRWWISKRARDLGFVSPRLSEPPWSEAEDELLGQHSHKTLSVIQRIFKSHGYTRSETAINVRRKRLHLNVRDPDRFTATQLARILGLDSKSVTRWIHLDMLPAEHRGTARTELQGGDMFWIRRDDVREFIRNNPERIDLRKVEKHMFIELLLGGGAQ